MIKIKKVKGILKIFWAPVKISPIQMIYAFHRFIHGYRGTEDWNDLDEQAYQVALRAR